MNAYFAIKHLHVACVILSGAGFFLRGLLMLSDSPLMANRWLKIVPHVNDTLLLLAALTLTAMIGQYPFVAGWVTAKIFGLIGYIILGSLALKAGRSKRVRLICWVLALLVFAWIVSVALTHDPRGFLALVPGVSG
ncbi:MAG TPA: SirB2 family protein [Rhodocyclaceae bacterium]|nr:SirB2 family protein [Rhodocyclaceae bacterium]